ncbi:M50 family metallopeptidase [Alkaliphilus peptidifermentans]|uniref:Stage IV sporulation protein FB n=1 Tax=Alkaliphilus peptidifermentans DSM 18978 TaxID=1120976 RepID=A0A1G5DM75_9FIRM|nr:M50 family metallopeptidase [Alkaliphilus peptidifermentans]SCY15508.1 stage IV sporulation protein FB [Alkaliphilus peptidifermentans DSM 18978]
MKTFQVGDLKLKINRLLLPIFLISFVFGYLREMLIIFLVVFIHEISHYLVAKKVNVKIEKIELFPFGGVAKMDHDYVIKPSHEVLIAAAGPFSNLLLLFLAELLIFYNIVGSPYIYFFQLSNVAIGAFNLLPIFPLDGGRVLRAIISIFYGIQKSTLLSIAIGKVFSIMILVLGIYLSYLSLDNIYLIPLAMYLYYQANAEKKMAVFLLMKEIIRKKETLLNKGIMNTEHLTVLDAVNLNMIFSSFKSGKYHFVTVIDREGMLIGTLTESQIIDGISKYGGQITLIAYIKIIKRKESIQ